MKLILAPMANISHSALRLLIADYDEPDEYFTEMIHAPSAISGGSFEKWYFRTNPSPNKLVWQITSPELEATKKAIPLLLDFGGFGIDLNMGCCAPQIVKTGAGFAWMQKSLLEVANFIKGTKNAIIKYQNSSELSQQKKIRFSVKLRLGESEDYSFLLKFSKMLCDEGVDLITLHPRTSKQKYSRMAKHKFTAQLAKDLSIPVYGNGDIRSAIQLQEAPSTISGWMIGRAAVQMPWIFQKIRSTLNSESIKESKTETIDLLKTSENFIKYLKTEQPPEFYITRAQRFFSYFCDNFSFAHYLKNKVLNSKTIDGMQAHIKEYLLDIPNERFV